MSFDCIRLKANHLYPNLINSVLVLRIFPLFILMILLLTSNQPLARAEKPIRIGLTKAVYVDESVAYDRWASYFSKKLSRPVKFIFRKSYNDIQQMLKWGEIDFAWICGYPYVMGKKEGFLRYVATPMIKNHSMYRIYLIVRADTDARSLASLKHKIFAFSDPDSVSFRALVKGEVGSERPIADLDNYFSIHFFTYDHVDTIRAVADHLADGGSIDSHVWKALIRVKPDLTRRVRVVAQSQEYGLPPFVSSIHVSHELHKKFRKVLLDMRKDAEGKAILDFLQMDGFFIQPSSLYDSIRKGPAGGLSQGQHVVLRGHGNL